jgi:hypothetical protein
MPMGRPKLSLHTFDTFLLYRLAGVTLYIVLLMQLSLEIWTMSSLIF